MTRDPLIGQLLGDYKIEQQLGEGAFATVYRGKDIHLDIIVAIKVLNLLSLSARDERVYRQNFQQEARIIAHLDHPRIVRVLRFGFTPSGLPGIQDQTPFLVMSYATHGSLRHAFPELSRLDFPTIAKYTLQVAEALQYAHDRKPSLVHRDIKPENIFLDARANALVGDFGIAVSVNAETHTPRDRSGTFRYIAPEQSQGHPKPASDQYSLGIMVYEWLTGDAPFKADNAIGLAIAHIRDPLPPLPPSIPNRQAIEAVLFRALAKKPEQRYPRIMDFALDLLQVLEQKTPPRLVKPTDATIVSPRLPISDADDPSKGAELSDSREQHVSVKPQTSPILPKPTREMGYSPVRPPIVISNALPTGSKVIDYREHHAVVSTVACSPDGALVASGDRNGYVHIWEPFAGNTVKTYQKSTLPINHLSWTFDRRLMISCGNEVLIVDLTRGQERSFVFPAIMNMVSLSADGRTLAMAGKDSTIHIGDMQSVQEIRRLKHRAEVLAISWNKLGTELASVSKDMTCRVYREDTLLWEYSEYPGSPFPLPIAIGKGQWAITAVDWNPDGFSIAIGAQNGMLRVLDSSTGNQLVDYQEPVGVKSVAWHPDGKVLASLSQTVKLRDERGEELLALPMPEVIEAFAWYPDGSALITCSGTIVSVWK